MSERDELAELIWRVEAEEIGTFKTGVTSKAADDIADAVLAAGWRPPTPPAHAIECSRPTPNGVMVDRLQAAVSAALALAQEWSDERVNFEEIHDYSNYRLSVLNNAAQKLRDAIGAALREQRMNIVDFLLARIAEDEKRANYYGPLALGTDRVLAECAAKREIIHWWVDGLIGYVRVDDELTNPLLPLASIYKDHPDYQQEWAPNAE